MAVRISCFNECASFTWGCIMHAFACFESAAHESATHLKCRVKEMDFGSSYGAIASVPQMESCCFQNWWQNVTENDIEASRFLLLRDTFGEEQSKMESEKFFFTQWSSFTIKMNGHLMNLLQPLRKKMLGLDLKLKIIITPQHRSYSLACLWLFSVCIAELARLHGYFKWTAYNILLLVWQSTPKSPSEEKTTPVKSKFWIEMILWISQLIFDENF